MELIKIEQMPKIEDNFEAISEEVAKRTELAKNLVVTEDTVKEVKKVRSDLNKESKEFADIFKKAKNEILEPWKLVEDSYKLNIVNVYQSADLELKSKIGDVEDTLKAEKREKVVEFFNEHRLANNVEWLDFPNINITLSASLKSLKEEAKAYCEKIASEIEVIGENSELMAEYRSNGLDYVKAVGTLKLRADAIERAEKEKAERLAREQAEKERIEEVQEVAEMPLEPLEPEVPKFTTSFRIRGTKEQFADLKKYIINSGIEIL